jgi:dienelactone hydrolase
MKYFNLPGYIMYKNYLVFIGLIQFIFLFAPYAAAQEKSTEVLKPVGAEAFEVLRQFFDYDKNIPLETKIVDRIDKQEYIREKFVFRGPRSKVPGYLAIPKNISAPVPCVLLLHGITGSKENWWDENSPMGQLTRQLLASGFAVLTLDAEYHGERLANNNFESPIELIKREWFVQSRDMMIQTVIEYRRVIDLLAARPDIDSTRIGVIGYSMGGVMAFNLSAADPRIKASVSCVSPVISVPYLPTAVHNSAPYISQPMLMLMADKDEKNYTKDQAQQLYNITGSKIKELYFYDSGHILPAEWINRAAEWMEKYLR